MTLEFRRLTSTDLSAIRNLSDSMDMRNDPKIGDIAESSLQDPKCVLFGAFRAEVLVGVGGLRNKGRELAWIESLRVHGEYQRTGVGTALVRYDEELARGLGYLRVGFQTVTENAGSCRIGEKLAFERKHEMTAFYARPENLSQSGAEHCRQAAVSAEEALLALKRIPNGPKDEICIGWSYVPISADFFDSELDMKFYVQDETVMLENNDRNPRTKEIESVRAILYGSATGVESIVSGFIARNAKRGLPLVCLCPEELIPDVMQMGFQFACVWTGRRNIVALFTKDLY